MEPFSKGKFSDKKVVITGGSSGIGLEAAPRSKLLRSHT